MTKANKRRRKIVEIYFILYLAALVLLIPDKKDDAKYSGEELGERSVYQLDFALKPMRTTLNCRLTLDSGIVKVIAIDSVNRIFYTGNVKDVEFEFSVEDRSLQRKVVLNDNTNDTKYFGFKEFPEDQMAEFIWFPPLLEYTNKTYIVEVTATARSTENNKILKENTQFTLNVSYVTDYDFAQLSMLADTAELGLSSQGESYEQTRFMNSRQLYSDFSIVPQTREIETVAMDSWENIITVYNLNLLQDLRVNPKIEVIDPKPGIASTLQYDIINENKLKIKGKAPEYGSSKVRLTLQRDYDGTSVTEEFKVSALMIGEPEFQSTMYPEINYSIKPNLPLSSNVPTTALIKTQNNDTLAISKGGNDFIYKPQHRDTALQLFFVRYIDGKLAGQKHELKVLSYPAPEISSLNEVTNTKVEIYTASKGIINGRDNYVTELEIEGNAKYRELTGNQKIDRNLNIRQKFEIIALDPAKPFQFTVKAKNIQGKISEETKWPKYK